MEESKQVTLRLSGREVIGKSERMNIGGGKK